MNTFAVGISSVVYSGPNRNIIYNESNSPGTISLFDAAGTWDDMRLNMVVGGNEYHFYNMLNTDGNYVEFAVGALSTDIKRFSSGEEIGSSLTYSSDSNKNFVDILLNMPARIEGEFRNQTGYAGLKFTDGTDIYYGWIQVSVSDYNNSNITGTLIDWAYNPTPGEPVFAGFTGE